MTTQSNKPYIGLMSGTSMDAIDAVLVALPKHAPLQVMATYNAPLPAALRSALQDLALAGNDALQTVAELDVEMGRRFAAVVPTLLDQAGIPAAEVAAIGSHGQTIRHHPQGPHPFTTQIGDPNIIAEQTGITTVADFRRRDIAAGGQGAPLVPAFHRALFRSPHHARAVLNLGGMANITLLPTHGPVTGYDTGPANVLLDAWAGRHLGRMRDDGGRWGAAGQVHQGLLHRLLSDPYFALPPPKSTGRELFGPSWLDRQLEGFVAVSPLDVQATLCELTARSVADAIVASQPQTEEVLVCGGGVYNQDLMGRLGSALAPRPVRSSAEFGLAPDWVEAVAFAWLARETLAGRPGNVPEVTGAGHRVVLGGIYPGLC